MASDRMPCCARNIAVDSPTSPPPAMRTGTSDIATLRVAWLDHVVNQLEAALIRDERALHRVDRDLLEVVDTQFEHATRQIEFLRHRRVAHQTIVRVQRDTETVPVVNPERMLFDA